MLLVHAFSKTWLSKIWFMFFPQTWLSKLWFMLCFPRLGCPSFGLRFVFQDLVVQVLVHFVFFPRLGCPSFGSSCIFSKTWLSKFWFMFFFQDLVVQVLVHVFFPKTWLSKLWFMLCFPRLGCPSFGLRFVFQDLVVQVLVHAFFPRLGCPSFGSCVFSQDLDAQVLVCCIFVQLIVQVLVFAFANTWLSKFWFVVLARLGCSSLGLLFVQDLVFVVGSFFPGLGCGSFSKSLSLSPAPSRRFEHQAEDIFFGFQVLVDVSSTVFEFNGVCSKMLICINLQAVVLHLLLHRRRQRLGGVS